MGMESSNDLKGPGQYPDMPVIASEEKVFRPGTETAAFSTLTTLALTC